MSGDIKHYFKDKKDSIKLLKLFKKTVKILNKNNITYWADGGTLIGAIRHNGLFKWDDDIDIVFLQKDTDKLLKLKSAFNKKGLDIEWTTHQKVMLKVWDKKGLKIYKPKMYTRNHTGYKHYRYPFIDLAPLTEQGKKFKYHKKINEWFGNKFYYLKSNIFPLKTTNFSNIMINIPNNPKAYLNRCYKNWDKIIHIRTNYDHKLDKKIKNNKPVKFKWNSKYKNIIYKLR